MINEIICSFREIDVRDTLIILSYELGDINKSIANSIRFPRDSREYLLFARTAVSDLLVQIKSLCEIYGWDYDKLADEGIERLLERAKERINDRVKNEYQGH